MRKNDSIPKIGSEIIKKKELILEFSSEKYSVAVQLKDDINELNSEIIVITAINCGIDEQCIYEIEMTFEDFQKLGKTI